MRCITVAFGNEGISKTDIVDTKEIYDGVSSVFLLLLNLNEVNLPSCYLSDLGTKIRMRMTFVEIFPYAHFLQFKAFRISIIF